MLLDTNVLFIFQFPFILFCGISLASTLLCVRTAVDTKCYLYQLRDAKLTTVPCPQQRTCLQTYLLLTILTLKSLN